MAYVSVSPKVFRVLSWRVILLSPFVHTVRMFVDVQMSGDAEKKYNSVFFEKDADGRPKGSNGRRGGIRI